MKRGADVTIGASTGGTSGNEWGAGWRLFLDSNVNGVFDTGEELIHVNDALDSGMFMDAIENDSALRYRPIGALSVSPQTRTIELCDDRTQETGRRIVISSTGRPQITSVVCS